MSDVNAKDRKRARDLFAMLGSSNPQEQATARKKLEALLKRLGKSWNDLAALVYDPAAAAPNVDPRDATPAPDVGADIFPPDLVRHALEQYVAFSSPHDAVAIALWALHTHVFDQFMITPRLVLTSPVLGCGKTTVLDVLGRLVARPYLSDNITAAAIYDVIDREHPTLLLDEGDNLGLLTNPTMRSVLNSGYRKGASIDRGVGKQRRSYSIFAPVALASIGILSLPLMSRSIVIRMTRHDGSTPLRRFDLADTADLDNVYRHIIAWVKTVQLNHDPVMPNGMHGRTANNWRAMISIADACSPAWGVLAREAAVHFARGYHDEDIAVTLLRDIRTIYNTTGATPFASKALVEALNAMDDSGWSEWRGPRDDQSPRRFSQGELAKVLRLFGIRPRSIRAPGNSSTAKGYHRHQFEQAWAAYCPEGGTPAQTSNVRQLRGA